MKKIPILFLLTTICIQGSEKNSLSTYQQRVSTVIARKEHTLEKEQEKLKQLEETGAPKNKIKKLKQNLATRRRSLKIYTDGLAALIEQRRQDPAYVPEQHVGRRQPCNEFCKRWYPHIAMGTLFTTLVGAVSVDVIRCLSL